MQAEQIRTKNENTKRHTGLLAFGRTVLSLGRVAGSSAGRLHGFRILLHRSDLHYLMPPINLVDRSKNPPDVQRDLAEWDKANVAEHLEAMERRGELKKLKAKSFDRAYKPRFTI